MNYVQIHTTSQPHMSSTNAAKNIVLLAHVIFGCACTHVLNVLKHLKIYFKNELRHMH